jgi:uncharacterized protein YceH (UPF0502 family)
MMRHPRCPYCSLGDHYASCTCSELNRREHTEALNRYADSTPRLEEFEQRLASLEEKIDKLLAQQGEVGG